MADRKRKIQQAINESNEASKPAPAPQKKAPTTKDFQLNPNEKAAASAPMHRRAAKTQRLRKEALQAGIAAGRAGNPVTGMEVSTPTTIGHKKVKNPAPYDSTLSSVKTYRAIK
jgi:hypothetical protein